MGLTLLFQTCLICLRSGLINQSFWFSYILFLIFLGGILVLFIYVASLASNEPFRFSFIRVYLFAFIFIITFLLFLFDSNFLPTRLNISVSEVQQSYEQLKLIGIIYSKPTMTFTLYIVIYLLLTLLVIVDITGNYFGPLRLSTYDKTHP